MSRRPRPTYVASLLTGIAALVLGLVPPTAASAGAPAGHAVTVTLADVGRAAALDRRVPVLGTVVDGTAHQALAGVRVELQVQSGRGWSTPPGAVAFTDARGRFTLDAPTFYYGRHAFRAVAAAQPSGAVTSPTHVITVPVPYRPAGRPGSGRLDGTRFDPCAPIPYRIDFAGAPRNARTLVAGALARARAATGLTFTYAGAYSGIPFSRQRDGGLPSSGIGFAWATPRQVSALAGGAIGLGGGGWSVGHRRTSSGVVIDRTFHFREGWTGPNSIGGLLLHEIGHALGLEHVSDRSQQMYPRDVGAPHGNYNRGDLTALRRIGLDAGCL